MSAVAPTSQSRTRPHHPRRGMRFLAAGLTLVCVIELLFVFEQTHVMAAWRAARDIRTPQVESLWNGAVASIGFSPPLRADLADAPLTGAFTAVDPDQTLRSLTFEHALIHPADGAPWRTGPLRIATGAEAFADGQTFARHLRAAPDAQIELRRIIDGPASLLCADQVPVMAALLHRGRRVDLMLFHAGPEPLCGTWTFETR